MTQPANPPPAAAQPSAAPASPPRSTVASRVAAIKAKAAAVAPTPQSAGEGAVAPPPTASSTSTLSPSDSGAGDQPPPVSADAEAARLRAERLARIKKGVAELRAREAAKNEERAQRAKYQQKDGELETLRKRLAELEPLEGAWKDPMSVLEWAEKKGVPAGAMVQALRDRTTNPEAVAAAAASSQAKAIEAAMRKELDEVKAAFAASEQRRQQEAEQARAQVEGQRKATEFHSRVTEKAAEYPLTAAFAKARGGNALVALANNFLAPHLPEDYTIEQLHDHTEQLLELFQVSGLGATSPAGDTPKSTGAEQPATTLGNRVTAGRETVVEEVPLHRLSKAERIARVRAKYGRK